MKQAAARSARRGWSVSGGGCRRGPLGDKAAGEPEAFDGAPRGEGGDEPPRGRVEAFDGAGDNVGEVAFGEGFGDANEWMWADEDASGFGGKESACCGAFLCGEGHRVGGAAGAGC